MAYAIVTSPMNTTRYAPVSAVCRHPITNDKACVPPLLSGFPACARPIDGRASCGMTYASSAFRRREYNG